MYKPGAYVGMDGKTREQYIDGNVKNSLNDEGEATITNPGSRRAAEGQGR